MDRKDFLRTSSLLSVGATLPFNMVTTEEHQDHPYRTVAKRGGIAQNILLCNKSGMCEICEWPNNGKPCYIFTDKNCLPIGIPYYSKHNDSYILPALEISGENEIVILRKRDVLFFDVIKCFLRIITTTKCSDVNKICIPIFDKPSHAMHFSKEEPSPHIALNIILHPETLLNLPQGIKDCFDAMVSFDNMGSTNFVGMLYNMYVYVTDLMPKGVALLTAGQDICGVINQRLGPTKMETVDGGHVWYCVESGLIEINDSFSFWKV